MRSDVAPWSVVQPPANRFSWLRALAEPIVSAVWSDAIPRSVGAMFSQQFLAAVVLIAAPLVYQIIGAFIAAVAFCARDGAESKLESFVATTVIAAAWPATMLHAATLVFLGRDLTKTGVQDAA